MSDISKITTISGETYDIKDAQARASIPTKVSDLENDSGYMAGMTILSYGSSTWADFIEAYSSNKVVYCRASSNANPASGSQTRLAFMAYVNNATNPTEVEFQYYRSVSSHTANQQGDQVYVYKLTNKNAWTVITRESYTKIITGQNMTSSYANSAITLNATVPTKTSDLTNDSGFITSETDPVFTASPAHGITSADITNWNDKSDFSGSYNDLTDKPTIPTVPTNVSAFTNDAGYLTTAPVSSVNTKTGAVVLTAQDVGALPDNTAIPEVSITRSITSGTKIATLTIDSTDTDLYAPNELPTVTTSDNGKVLMVVSGAWAASTLPTYNGGAS